MSCGAIEGTRTPTPLPVHGPEPCASANSATMAILNLQCSGGPKAAVSGRLTSLFLQPCTCLSNHRQPRSYGDTEKTQRINGSAKDFLCASVVKGSSQRRHSLTQLRGHRDLRVQHFRYRTTLLCRLRIFLKRGRVRSWNFAHHINVARRNRPA